MGVVKTMIRVVFEAEASVWGGSKAGGLPHPSISPFPPSPFPFHLSFRANKWEGRSDPVRGKFPGFPPHTNTTLTMIRLATMAVRLPFDCSSTVIRLFDDRRFNRTCVCVGCCTEA